jgi:BirA family transcriptional regulator, biotin operon repressor / biotin---[acetyl-CoA-carboxylase] ligase
VSGFRVVHLDEVDSTNRELMERARAGEPEGLVLVADRQTAGRGRQGRSWLSSPGDGLLFSVLRRPPVAATEAFRWTLLAGLAARQAVAPHLPVPGAWLKWPNDLLVGERKLAGILCELHLAGDRPAIVVGVGLNVHAPRGGWPEEVADRATSLEEAGGAPLPRDARARVLEALLTALEGLEDELVTAGAGPLMERSRAAMQPLFGRRVRVELDGTVQDVVVRGVRDSGALEVVDESGRCRPLLAGDVHLGGP